MKNRKIEELPIGTKLMDCSTGRTWTIAGKYHTTCYEMRIEGQERGIPALFKDIGDGKRWRVLG